MFWANSAGLQRNLRSCEARRWSLEKIRLLLGASVLLNASESYRTRFEGLLHVAYGVAREDRSMARRRRTGGLACCSGRGRLARLGSGGAVDAMTTNLAQAPITRALRCLSRIWNELFAFQVDPINTGRMASLTSARKRVKPVQKIHKHYE